VRQLYTVVSLDGDRGQVWVHPLRRIPPTAWIVDRSISVAFRPPRHRLDYDGTGGTAERRSGARRRRLRVGLRAARAGVQCCSSTVRADRADACMLVD
jgi:hypothetical protein